MLGFIGFSEAQTITIVDQETKKPLQGVTLTSSGEYVIITTNQEGQADITAFKEESQIQIQSLGYKTVILSFTEIENLEFIVPLTTARLELDEVVVSATRYLQNSSNIPVQIISISPEEVAFQNPQTAADALSISGKVFIQKSQQGGGSPMIRGFATNRLIYTVDGVRMNTAIFRGGNLQNVINLDPFAIEKTEVLFGPGSVIYGSDAIGGVMSFQTLTPQFSPTSNTPHVKGKAITRYASANNEKTGHVDVCVGWKKWALISSFSSWDYDHLRQGSKGPDDYIKDYFVQRQNNLDVLIAQDNPLLQIPSGYSQFNMMQKVWFNPYKEWNLQYGFHYSTTSSYGRYDRHNRLKNGTARYGEWNYGPQQWLMNNLSASHQKNGGIYTQMTLRLAHQLFEESRINRSINSNLRTSNIEKVKAYSFNLDLTKNVRDYFTLFYGVEYVLNKVFSEGRITDLTTNVGQTGPARYPNANWTSAAVYVNSELLLSKDLSIQAGLRYNRFLLNADFTNNKDFYPFPFHEASLNNGSLTGSLGGVYRPTEKWIIKGSLGTAFRSPNVDDIGKVFDSEPGSLTIPNPNLQAEYAYNLDLGLAKVFGDLLKIELTTYYTSLQNALVRRNFQLNSQDSILYDGVMSQIQAIQNAAVAHVFGVQAGLEIKLPAGFTIFSDINYQSGKEAIDNGFMSPSRHAAPLFGLSRLRFRKNNLILEGNIRFQGERPFNKLALEERNKDEIYAKDSNGNNYAPAWYTLNLKILYRINDTFIISGGVENLTDQRYRPYSSGISGAGRNFILSFSAEF